jgi:hypothetical protein
MLVEFGSLPWVGAALQVGAVAAGQGSLRGGQ